MIKPKKILAIGIKLLICVISFYIIYARLNSTPHLKEQLAVWFLEPRLYLILAGTLLLMPVNWGIESYKWKLITSTVEPVSYSTAVKSVFSGICVGNIAPGRAMEFLAKIFFFKPGNRPVITVLHFINGMFQMLITVMFGVVAVAGKFNTTTSPAPVYFVFAFGIFMIAFFFPGHKKYWFYSEKIKIYQMV